MSRGLLLDTCAAIWLAEGEPLLPESREAIRTAARTSTLNVSLFVAWEVGLLEARSRRGFFAPAAAWFQALAETEGLNVLPLTAAILVKSHALPGAPPSDPADRIFIATAREAGLAIVTRDRRILAYGAEGHVRTLAC
jgi:PIN domain nuclease of toxin-antitoxin system